MKTCRLLATLSLAVAGLAGVASAQAQTPAPAAPPAPTAPADFATHKAQLVARLDQRVTQVTAMRDCVNSANSPADLKSCRQQAKMHHHHDHAPA